MPMLVNCSSSLAPGLSVFSKVTIRRHVEGKHRNNKDSRFHVDVEDWAPEAFWILMNIFHGRNSPVPRFPKVEILIKFAVLVYYDEFLVVDEVISGPNALEQISPSSFYIFPSNG
ncbi:hypothetical protein GQ43DRAFT_460514 [Delitschia confertaspora ATCC 74209]|uniref:BTB domain-containing protein n=1 Tax=Delitschia confertaspora ATCC 74209 TaxID=1513339 RepID=A0A9P4MW28_9PLEO|nr:hypothetical protein GQ43DRAFT_460514 [Delitschia confertaspora ATCC 74209]